MFSRIFIWRKFTTFPKKIQKLGIFFFAQKSQLNSRNLQSIIFQAFRENFDTPQRFHRPRWFSIQIIQNYCYRRGFFSRAQRPSHRPQPLRSQRTKCSGNERSRNYQNYRWGRTNRDYYCDPQLFVSTHDEKYVHFFGQENDGSFRHWCLKTTTFAVFFYIKNFLVKIFFFFQ